MRRFKRVRVAETKACTHCSYHEGGAGAIGRRFRPVQLLADNIDLRLVHSCVRVCVSMLNSDCMPLEYGTTVATVFAIDS